MAGVRRVNDLACWQAARHLVKDVHGFSALGIITRDFALTNQLRRSAISVMANIAEGFDRHGHAEFHRFLGIAKSPCVELETLLQISVDIGYPDTSHYESPTARTRSPAGSLGKLMVHLRRRSRNA